MRSSTLFRVILTFMAICGLTFLLAGCPKEPPPEEPEAVETAAPTAAPTVAPTAAPTAEATPAAMATPKVTETEVAPEATPTPDASEMLQSAAETIHFDFNKSDLKPEARTVLQNIADAMQGNALRIKIEGNCDERGTAEYNMALGERRANSAKKYLQKLGVAASRIDTISFGEENPVDPAHTEAAWAKNRRDDFVVLP